MDNKKQFPPIDYAVEQFKCMYKAFLEHEGTECHFSLGHVTDHRDMWCVIVKDGTVVDGFRAVKAIEDKYPLSVK